MSRLEQLRRLAEMMPSDPLAHYGLALEHLGAQSWDDAIASFDRTLALDAGYSAAYYHKARAQLGAGRGEEARTTLTAGMEAARAKGDWKTQNEMQELLDSL
ncbi:MAG: hypothetical protein CHACPFDD_02397 [Phycisphaerae bacterium]|nr:hypothetical protein [Phycisphaerae bacterium]